MTATPDPRTTPEPAEEAEWRQGDLARITWRTIEGEPVGDEEFVAYYNIDHGIAQWRDLHGPWFIEPGQVVSAVRLVTLPAVLAASTAVTGGECEQCAGTGVVGCWSPGGPCPVPDEPGCDTCGPCNLCAAAVTGGLEVEFTKRLGERDWVRIKRQGIVQVEGFIANDVAATAVTGQDERAKCGCGRRCAWCGAGGATFAPEEDFPDTYEPLVRPGAPATAVTAAEDERCMGCGYSIRDHVGHFGTECRPAAAVPEAQDGRELDALILPKARDAAWDAIREQAGEEWLQANFQLIDAAVWNAAPHIAAAVREGERERLAAAIEAVRHLADTETTH